MTLKTSVFRQIVKYVDVNVLILIKFFDKLFYIK